MCNHTRKTSSEVFLRSKTADKIAADETTGEGYDVPCFLGMDSTKPFSKSQVAAKPTTIPVITA